MGEMEQGRALLFRLYASLACAFDGVCAARLFRIAQPGRAFRLGGRCCGRARQMPVALAELLAGAGTRRPGAGRGLCHIAPDSQQAAVAQRCRAGDDRADGDRHRFRAAGDDEDGDKRDEVDAADDVQTRLVNEIVFRHRHCYVPGKTDGLRCQSMRWLAHLRERQAAGIALPIMTCVNNNFTISTRKRWQILKL